MNDSFGWNSERFKFFAQLLRRFELPERTREVCAEGAVDRARDVTGNGIDRFVFACEAVCGACIDQSEGTRVQGIEDMLHRNRLVQPHVSLNRAISRADRLLCTDRFA